MSYRITKVIFTTNVKINQEYLQIARAENGVTIEMGDYGYVKITHPNWSHVYHVGPSLIAGMESEHVAPAPPQEDTRVTKRPTSPKRAA